MKRKIFSFILALTIMAGMGSIAYAAEPDGTGSHDFSSNPSGSATAEVYGKYKAAEFKPTYCVKITWPSTMEFSYTTQGDRKWDPVNHKYNDGNVKFKWETQELIIGVENRSNAPVKVTADYDNSNGQGKYKDYGIDVSLDETTMDLDSADGGLKTEDKFTLSAKPKQGYLTPSFTDVPENAIIGRLILTVSVPTENP